MSTSLICIAIAAVYGARAISSETGLRYQKVWTIAAGVALFVEIATVLHSKGVF